MNLEFYSSRNAIKKSLSKWTIFIAIMCLGISSVSATAQPHEAAQFQELHNNSSIPINLENSSETTEDNDDFNDGIYGYQKHPSKIAAVAVYCVFAFVGIFGVLVKYFVMQHERLQAKAQLEYQQLQAVKTY